MAKNFEVVFPVDKPIKMADGSQKLWSYEQIKSVCESHNCQWIIARHPKDTADLDNPKSCAFDHFHCGIHTSSDNVYGTIAKWFGILTNSVQGIKSKFESTYALYVRHYNAVYDNGTPKPSIPDSDITSNFGLDYSKLIGRVETSNASEQLLLQIADGTIKRYQFKDRLSDAFRIKYSSQIKSALEIWNDRKMREAREDMKNVIWIYGTAGVGKTELAKFLAKTQNKDFYMSDSGTNPFDNYADEPCIILDDVGADNLNGKVILKLFDPYNKCFTKARYYNKAIDADLIIVTSSVSPEQFWVKCRDSYDVDGSWEQLLRRLTGGVYHIHSDKRTMELTMYDSDGSNPFTAVVNIPDSVLHHTVTVSAEVRANDMLAKLGLTAVVQPTSEQLSFDISGQITGFKPSTTDNPFTADC